MQWGSIFLILSLVTLANVVYARRNVNSLCAQAKTLLDWQETTQIDAVLFWNTVMLTAAGNDYDQSIAETPDQIGPTATSRAFAIVHGAVHDALSIFERVYKPLTAESNSPAGRSISRAPGSEAAVTEAAYETLYQLYPKQRPLFDAARLGFLKTLRNDITTVQLINQGKFVGYLLARNLLEIRKTDGSQIPSVYAPINQSGYHQLDPTRSLQSFLGSNWGNVKPFIINSGSQFRADGFVGNTTSTRRDFLASSRYLRDYREVLMVGSRYNSSRTSDQTEIGIFWGYDGAPKLGVPPRLYNQIVSVIAIQQNNTLQQNAKLFALVNYAMADSGVAAWETKYYYQFWRPIVGIRQGSAATNPNPNWIPLGAPADGAGDNFTPPFPSYVSGHSTFGSATFEILRLFYSNDSIPFRFQSDEYNGVTVDSITGQARPVKTRQYRSFTQAENENFLSRIYLGVHWRFDQDQGKVMGRNIARYIYDRLP